MGTVYRFSEMATLLQRSSQSTDDEDDAESSKQTPIEVWLLQDCCTAQLMEPNFAADAVHFMVLEVRHGQHHATLLTCDHVLNGI